MAWLLALSLATALQASPSPPPATVPGFVDGVRLHSLCNPTEGDAASEPLCSGYIVGSVDQLLARQARRTVVGRTICMPKNLPVDELVDAISRHLVQHPKIRPAAAAALVREALETLYPCKPQPDLGQP